MSELNESRLSNEPEGQARQDSQQVADGVSDVQKAQIIVEESRFLKAEFAENVSYTPKDMPDVDVSDILEDQLTIDDPFFTQEVADEVSFFQNADLSDDFPRTQEMQITGRLSFFQQQAENEAANAQAEQTEQNVSPVPEVQFTQENPVVEELQITGRISLPMQDVSADEPAPAPEQAEQVPTAQEEQVEEDTPETVATEAPVYAPPTMEEADTDVQDAPAEKTSWLKRIDFASYSHMLKPGLIILGVMILLVLLIVDFAGCKLSVDTDKTYYVECGQAFEGPDIQVKLTGGLLGFVRTAEVEPKEPVDTGTVGEHEVTYQVKCNAFWLFIPRTFEDSFRLKVVVRDTTAPVITLKTAEVPSSYRGASYLEEGYTAIDACDGDVTAMVTSYQEGDQVFYSVTDSNGNTATAVRDIVYRDGVQSNGKTVYLTFDDGPGKYTDRLLDVLAKYNVKATFFVVNTDHPHIMERIAAEGHSIGVHSYSHKLKEIYISEETFFSDVDQMQAIIEQYTGSRTKFLRFPGGSSNSFSRYNPGIMTRLSAMVSEQGYLYFDWNVDSDDAGDADTPEAVFENVKTGIESMKNSVVLQHDIKEYSVDAVEKIIIWGLENGYTFRALTEESPTCHHKIYN